MKTLGILLFLISVSAFAQNETISSLVAPKGKVLIVLSSQAQLGTSNVRTGIWLPSAVHPYISLLNAGYEVDYASPLGGEVPIEKRSDPFNANSLVSGDFLTRGFISDKTMFNKLVHTKKLADVKAQDYRSILISGGLAGVYDLPDNKDIQRLLLEFFHQNKPIAAISYGVYAFLKMKTPSGRALLKGVELTAISKDEEIKLANALGWNPNLVAPKGFLEDLIKKEHAGFKSGPAFQSFTFVGAQGHFITAQQAFSGLELGLRLAKTLEKPLKPYEPKSEKYLRLKTVMNQ
jgi:putative intracellular protease/amidase